MGEGFLQLRFSSFHEEIQKGQPSGFSCNSGDSTSPSTETCVGNEAGNGATVTPGPSGPNPAHSDGDTVFRGFVVDPLDALVVYLGTERNGSACTTDGGATWTRLRWNDVGYPEIWSLAINRSIDGGAAISSTAASTRASRGPSAAMSARTS